MYFQDFSQQQPNQLRDHQEPDSLLQRVSPQTVCGQRALDHFQPLRLQGRSDRQEDIPPKEFREVGALIHWTSESTCYLCLYDIIGCARQYKSSHGQSPLLNKRDFLGNEVVKVKKSVAFNRLF